MTKLIDVNGIINVMKQQAGCATCNNYNGIRCRACQYDDAITSIYDYSDYYTVEAIPIEFIEEFIQGIIQTRDKQIQDTSKWRHFDDNIVVLDALLDSWKEEQKNEHSEEGSEVQ